jgi:DNA-binding MarR family transcriptional regulator
MEDVQQLVAALFTVKNSLERAQRHSPRANQLAVLQIIAAHEGSSPKMLAADLDVHPSSVTRQVQGLSDAGLVAVVANQEDRRSCCISLTDAGRQELNRLTQIGLGRFAQFVAEWDAQEVRTLAGLLWKLELSKAEVASQEPHARGRHWQQKA